jgi:hypothetical protein
MDPDLAVRVEHHAVERARERCTAELISLSIGPVSAPSVVHSRSDYLGLLVLQGILLYRLTLAGRETVDLVGPGDVIQTWPTADEYADPLIGSRWQALQPVTLAGLDRRFMRESAPWPELTAAMATLAVGGTATCVAATAGVASAACASIALTAGSAAVGGAYASYREWDALLNGR